jgi:hypothetical protein
VHPPIRVLLEQLIDYAGLFPPAGLSMREAVRNYAGYREGGFAFALGRFIVPAARLAEFVDARDGIDGIWPLSVLLSPSIEDDFRAIAAFGHEGMATLESIEVKAATRADIERIAQLAAGRETFVEIALEATALLDDLARLGLRAKIRTGGITQDAFPTAAAIAGFIEGCAARGVAFKATAGLHHPIRCVQPLTYEANAETGTMHGFLNVFLAAALVCQTLPGSTPAGGGQDARSPRELLLQSESEAFGIDEHAITWRGNTITTDTLKKTRETLARSFGSCSFEEPLSDLHALGWL